MNYIELFSFKVLSRTLFRGCGCASVRCSFESIGLDVDDQMKQVGIVFDDKKSGHLDKTPGEWKKEWRQSKLIQLYVLRQYGHFRFDHFRFGVRCHSACVFLIVPMNECDCVCARHRLLLQDYFFAVLCSVLTIELPRWLVQKCPGIMHRASSLALFSISSTIVTIFNIFMSMARKVNCFDVIQLISSRSILTLVGLLARMASLALHLRFFV